MTSNIAPAWNAESRAQLIASALENRRRAYAPYSRFQVGAGLLCADGSVFGGCNVENASLGLSLCAERVAVCQAISAGHRDIVGIAIAAAPLASPCGACRQFLAEFNANMEVIAVDASTGEQKSWRLAELLPAGFTLQQP